MPDFSSSLPVVGSLASGLLGKSAADDAAAASGDATAMAVLEQKAAREQGREDLAPHRIAGTNAINFLQRLLLPGQTGGIDPAFQAKIEEQKADIQRLKGMAGTESVKNAIARKRDNIKRFTTKGRARAKQQGNIDVTEVFEKTSPGFRFRQSEGQNALNNIQAARGNFLSGRGVKEALRYNQDFASNEFGNFINRLFAMSGQGLNAASSTANAGVSSGNAISNLLANQGRTSANAIMEGSNAIRGGISSGIDNYLALQSQQDLLNALA